MVDTPKEKQPPKTTKELLEVAAEGARKVFTKEEYRDYLKFVSGFHQYSVRNQLLIYLQNPHTTFVAGFNRVCTRISDRNIRELIYPKGVLKMTYSRNRYDQDFKKNAVRLSFNSSKPVKIIASELGVPESALYRWRKLYTEDGKQTPLASLEAENRALKRENAELALERDMLKKAAAYFASLQK